jgi:phosphoenolpyruvate carboxykinase (GTP)
MKFGKDGRLYAINPEAGFFGVAPGTSMESNPNAMHTITKNTIFTNVALTDDGDVWWEGIGTPAPAHLIDWKGKDWTPDSKDPAAHPNARFTTPAKQCPSIAPEWEDPNGVPISAILIGGRRPSTIPLVNESFDWKHGIFLGSIMGSEITAATISSKIGQVRRDPFAMLPFIGYNATDYLAHWLSIGEATDESKLPKIFYVNWFRKSPEGKFLWPGYGDNSRVLKWIVQRVSGEIGAQETPIGYLPRKEDLDVSGLELKPGALDELLKVDNEGWKGEVESIKEYYATYGGKLPKEMYRQLDALVQRIAGEVMAEIDCTQCGHCCRALGISLDDDDIARLTAHLRCTREHFEAQYLTPTDTGERVFTQIPCVFQQDNLCAVYEARPRDCREYPHLLKSDFRSRTLMLISQTGDCSH